jgi:hypothetical protein
MGDARPSQMPPQVREASRHLLEAALAGREPDVWAVLEFSAWTYSQAFGPWAEVDDLMMSHFKGSGRPDAEPDNTEPAGPPVEPDWYRALMGRSSRHGRR